MTDSWGELPGLAEVEAAARRIEGRIRRTPLLRAAPVSHGLESGIDLHLKLENLQVTGSFKARGAVNAVLSLPEAERRRGLVTASGGNHGLGVAYAGWATGSPATVVLPANAPASKAQAIERWGARVLRHGDVWDDANRAARELSEREGSTYVHPFAAAAVIAGQGTVASEILADLPDLDLLVVAIGGGGLIAGVAMAAKTLRPGLRVVGVEPEGAPTLHDSLRAGRVIELEEIRTAANTLAPRRSHENNLELVRRHVEGIVLVSDEAMRQAARWLWRELGIAPELAGAAAVAALLEGKVAVASGTRVAAIVCGAGTAGWE